jgi:hypothetical protein
VKGRQAQFLSAAKKDVERLKEDDARLVALALRTVRDVVAGVTEGKPPKDMPMTGDLRDCRKVYFGVGSPPSHRIVYRELDAGQIEVVEVVAVEAREESYVYLLAASRLDRLPDPSRTRFARLHQRVITRRATARKRR